MQPLKLSLKGFRGIRDGLGRDELSLDIEALTAGAQLVALVGPNGCGKTTIAENLHPYRLMPSRATSASVGGFSYYEHLCGAEAGKDLEWMHEGRRFRSQLVFRLNGARRTEAYLHEWRGDRWVPVVLPDGTRSDGRTDTYDRCVEGLLGSPETFFTSAFRAQQRRQLSAYRPGEVKSLLVELLGLERIRAAGQDAGRVAAQLQRALEQQRAALARHRSVEAAVQQLRRQIDDAESRIRSAATAKATAQQLLQAAQQQLAVRDAERTAAVGTEALRQSLQAQATDLARRKAAAVAARARAADELKSRRERTALSLREAEETAAATRARHQREIASAQALIGRQDAIRSAVERLPVLAQQEQAARRTLRTAEEASERRAQMRQRLQVIAASRQGLERDAGTAVLRARQLQERLQLTQEVPCRGTELQGACKLLANAREAKALQPSADLKIAQVRQAIGVLDVERDQLQRELGSMADSTTALERARTALETVIEQHRRVHADAALAGQLSQAQDRLRDITADTAAVEKRLQSARAAAGEEFARCDAVERETTERHTAEVADLDATAARLRQQLGALPLPFDDAKRAAAEQTVRAAQRALNDAEANHAAAVTQRAELGGRLQAATDQMGAGAGTATAVTHLETELALWTALSKALGNDGVIALCIDDAGPTLASLTNELLLSCYGPRFTVGITTQVETAKKDLKEGFDVIVFDADTGASKSVALMSGGEKVWVDEALTRAIALYLSQSAGRRYRTLFSDEADGPLDPERKRMFIAMKREVLRLGGYEREIFVSQTPELWGLADRVIDVTQLAEPETQSRSLTI